MRHASTTVAFAYVVVLLTNSPAAQAQTADTWSLRASGLWNVANSGRSNGTVRMVETPFFFNRK